MATNTIYLDRSDTIGIAKDAILQALFRVRFPVNAQIALERFLDINDPYVPTNVTARFLDPRRFVLWAVKEGYVPDEYRKECLRYARGR